MVKRFKYDISIQRPAAIVYDKMLGITDKATYTAWTSLFSPTSSYQGSWEAGTKMLFVAEDKNGNLAGMVSRILENKPNQLVSIQHYGMLKDGVEITEGPEVEGWSGGLEIYSFEEKDDVTIAAIEIDADEAHQEFMDKQYPNTLQLLKEVCESN